MGDQTQRDILYRRLASPSVGRQSEIDLPQSAVSSSIRTRYNCLTRSITTEHLMNSLVSQAPVTQTRPFIRKIVVAVDLTARSLVTAEYAVAVAKSFGASLIFVYVHPTE